MPLEAKNKEVVNHLIQVLTELYMEPQPVQRGAIRELRGGVVCIDLKGSNDIDSLVLLSKINSLWDYAEYRYRIDYALRGGIRGILAGREIARVKSKLVGFLRKSIQDVEWAVPKERGGEKARYATRIEGIPLKPGEIWENGPHQTLTLWLNKDEELRRAILNLLREEKDKRIRFEIFSDGWRESIRLTGGVWLEHPDVLESYTSEDYLFVASRVFSIIKEVRRRFGGIAF